LGLQGRDTSFLQTRQDVDKEDKIYVQSVVYIFIKFSFIYIFSPLFPVKIHIFISRERERERETKWHNIFSLAEGLECELL
jgi:uncharacterized membrane protein YeiB